MALMSLPALLRDSFVPNTVSTAKSESTQQKAVWLGSKGSGIPHLTLRLIDIQSDVFARAFMASLRATSVQRIISSTGLLSNFIIHRREGSLTNGILAPLDLQIAQIVSRNSIGPFVAHDRDA